MSRCIYNQDYLRKLHFADQQATATRLIASEFRFGPPPIAQPYLRSFGKFMDLPTEVITEVLCNVTPFELLSLSHTCKSLHDLILRRNSEYIWSAAESNSSTYPSYPWADISKPRFAGMLFMMICSTCRQYTANPLDPFLLIRLCTKCCPKEFPTAVTTNFPAILGVGTPYIFPVKCDPLLATHPRYTLRKHYEAISSTMSLLSRSVSIISYHRWVKETKEEVRLRQKFGQSLNAYFERLEAAYQKSLEGVKNQRTKEVKKRLRALGWVEEDFDFAPPQFREWSLLVNQPTPLTDQEWSELHLKLGPLLFSNRTRARQARREKNSAEQNAQLSEFLKGLKADLLWHPLLPFFRALGITHQPQAVTAFLDSYPFPSDELAKTWPFFFDVGNTDLSEKELRTRFVGDRERVKAHIASWRMDIEITLANRLMEERGVRMMAEAEPLCRVEVSRSDQITKDLPLYVQLLLRADSLFTDGSSKCKPLYYPEFIPTKPQFVLGHTRPVVSMDRFHRAPEAEQVARALLAELELKNASHLELATFGERFVCFRCAPRSRKLMDWKGILNHYLDEQRCWKLALRGGPRFKTFTCIPMECAHRLNPIEGSPLVEFLTPGTAKLWKLSTSHLLLEEDKYFCILCKNFGYAFLGSDVKALRKHMHQVHICTSRIMEDVHYGSIVEGKTFLETGAGWRNRWNEFNHDEGPGSEDESE